MQVAAVIREPRAKHVRRARYVVSLADDERDRLHEAIRSPKTGPQKRMRAQILLAADRGVRDVDIVETLGCGYSTVYRTRRTFVEAGFEFALEERLRPGGARKLTAVEEAQLVALACTTPPEGRAHWTLELLAGRLIRITEHESISTETVRRRLAENQLKPWQKKMWCIPAVDAEFVLRMEDVLDLYAEAPDEARPVVCFDETPAQLIAETRKAIAATSNHCARVDYEYERKGVRNLFMFVDANFSWRHVEVTARHTAVDFANCMRDLVDVHYPRAELIRVVLDNVSTHRGKNLYEVFAPDEARRILRKLDFHFTPTHASWLNRAEIEISVLMRQCLDRRIPDEPTLRKEVRAWAKARNASGARTKWMFTTQDARAKLGKSYPSPSTTPRECRS